MLNDAFGEMKIQRIGDTYSGMILPNLNEKYEEELGVTALFVNPQLRPQEFQKLLEM